MAYRYGQERNQMLLFPQSIDQYVGEDHPVRAYDAFVDTLDFDELGIDLNAHKVGNSQYDPQLMLKLLLYAYSYGLKGSRKIERATHENIAFMWLMKNLKPDHKTVAEFRRKNKKALKTALKLCARLCLKMDLIQANVLFVDSTKLRANAGKKHQHRKKWYQKQLKAVDQRIEQLLAECEQIDQNEADQGSWVKMPKELSQQKHLKATIQSALDEFKNRGTHAGSRTSNAPNAIIASKSRLSVKRANTLANVQAQNRDVLSHATYVKISKRKSSSVLSKSKAAKYTSGARPGLNIRLDISKRSLASANFL